MDSLNYHHLHAFWTVAREGSIVRAASTLRVSQPTLSTQVKALEAALGTPLFARAGRGLVLTEAGQVAFRHCEQIFALGRAMTEALRTGGATRLVVGLADVVPKLVAYRLLDAVLARPHPPRIVVREDAPEALLAELLIHRVDLVVVDDALPPWLRARAHLHLLADTGVTFLARRPPAGAFPGCLHGAPFLLPLDSSAVRRGLERWFEAIGVVPQVVGEFADGALLKMFAAHGHGAFAVPSVIAEDVQREYGVVSFGETQDVRERLYAATLGRRVRDPVVLAMIEAAKGWRVP